MRLVTPQSLLGPRSFFVCVLLLDLLQIIALDMYAPALPAMQRSFGVSASYLNQTMFSYLLVASFTMLFAGIVSDRVGRKPVIVAGAVVFAVSSLGCALATSVEALVALRCGQAIGYGISSTIAPAMLKDAYDESSVKVSLSLMQSLVIVGPVLAPFLGSLMLGLTDWRGIFVFLAVCGVIALALSLLVTETLPAHCRARTTFLSSLRGMATGARLLTAKRGFASLSAFMAIGGVPFFAFIAISSYILLDEFGVGYMEFSIVYAGACVVNMAAPYIYLALSKRMNIRAIAWLSTVLTCVSAALLATVGPCGAIGLLLAFVPYALAEGIIRPAALVELLDQPPTLVGTASALSNFVYHVLTALATVAAAWDWPTFLLGLTAVTAATSIALLLLSACASRTWAQGS